MMGYGKKSLKWCFSIITANVTDSGFHLLKREIISRNSFSNLMLSTGLQIPVNAHFRSVTLLIVHKAFSFQKYLICFYLDLGCTCQVWTASCSVLMERMEFYEHLCVFVDFVFF